MLLRLLKAERLKLKRSPVWLAFLLMPVVPALLGTINYIANIDILQSEWYSLWTQHTLFTCYFFLPSMVGVYCAYLMRLEHAQNNWNKMMTMPVHKPLIFLSKLIAASVMILLSELWIAALFVFSGKLAGINTPVPVHSIVIWCLFGSLGGTVMAAIQLLVSICIKSFALPVGISLAGGISGLIFLAKNLGHIWPYSLMACGMNSNAPQKMLKSGYAGFMIVCAVYILIITAVASVVINRNQV